MVLVVAKGTVQVCILKTFKLGNNKEQEMEIMCNTQQDQTIVMTCSQTFQSLLPFMIHENIKKKQLFYFLMRTNRVLFALCERIINKNFKKY